MAAPGASSSSSASSAAAAAAPSPSPSARGSGSAPTCNECGVVATVRCHDCEDDWCAECSADFHRMKKTRMHRRSDILLHAPGNAEQSGSVIAAAGRSSSHQPGAASGSLQHTSDAQSSSSQPIPAAIAEGVPRFVSVSAAAAAALEPDVFPLTPTTAAEMLAARDSHDLPKSFRLRPGGAVYVCTRWLGGGGFGAVWKAHKGGDPKQPRAIKFAQLGVRGRTADSKQQERYRRETELQHKLKHPNIVQLYDYEILGDDNAGHTCVMILEYCGGGSLHDLIQERGALTEAEARDFILQLRAGLMLLHALKIIHRDLKPTHLMLNANRTQLKIGYFGLACTLGDSSFTAVAVGMWTYMAPECMEGRPHDRSDLWSVGIILLEMLLGREGMKRHIGTISSDFDWMLLRHPVFPLHGMPSACDELVHGLLRGNPNARLSWDKFADNMWLSERFSWDDAIGSSARDVLLATGQRPASATATASDAFASSPFSLGHVEKVASFRHLERVGGVTQVVMGMHHGRHEAQEQEHVAAATAATHPAPATAAAAVAEGAPDDAAPAQSASPVSDHASEDEDYREAGRVDQPVESPEAVPVVPPPTIDRAAARALIAAEEERLGQRMSQEQKDAYLAHCMLKNDVLADEDPAPDKPMGGADAEASQTQMGNASAAASAAAAAPTAARSSVSASASSHSHPARSSAPFSAAQHHLRRFLSELELGLASDELDELVHLLAAQRICTLHVLWSVSRTELKDILGTGPAAAIDSFRCRVGHADVPLLPSQYASPGNPPSATPAAELGETLRNAQSAANRLAEQLEAHRAEVQELRDDLTAEEAQCDARDAQLQEARAEASALRAEVARLRGEAAAAAGGYDAARTWQGSAQQDKDKDIL